MKVLYLKKKHKGIISDSFPNFHKNGSIIGMKKRFYGKDALLIRYGNYIYNVDIETYNKVKAIDSGCCQYGGYKKWK